MVIDSCLDCEASILWKSFVIKGPPREVKSARKWGFFFGVTRTSCAAGRGGVSSSSSNLVWWDLKRRSCKSFPSLGCACKSWIDMQAGMSVFANSPLCIIGQVFFMLVISSDCRINSEHLRIWFLFHIIRFFHEHQLKLFPECESLKAQHELSWFVGMCRRFVAVLTLDFSDLLA